MSTQLPYKVRPFALFDGIDGEYRTFENSQNFFESLKKSAKMPILDGYVCRTLGRKLKIISPLVLQMSLLHPGEIV